MERFARANPHLLPHLGLRKPPGHTILTLLLHRLDPHKLQEALHKVFPEVDLGEVLVVDGKHLRGSGKGRSPQVRLVEVLALHLKTTLAQARAEGREDRALLELLDRLGAEGLKGKVVVGDAGYLYPEVAGKVVEKGGVPLRSEGQPGGSAGVGPGGVQGDGGEAASRGDGGGLGVGAGRGGDQARGCREGGRVV